MRGLWNNNNSNNRHSGGQGQQLILRLALCLEFNIIHPFHPQSSPGPSKGGRALEPSTHLDFPAGWEREARTISGGVWEVWEWIRSPSSRGHKSGARSYWTGESKFSALLVQRSWPFPCLVFFTHPSTKLQFLRNWRLMERLELGTQS